MAQHFKQLIAWQKAVNLVTEVYQTTKAYPREEIYGLTSQLRRAAVSIPSNIAEGAGRRTEGEYVHFLGLAYGSLCELETQLIVSIKLKFVTRAVAEPVLVMAAEVGRIINGLISSLTTDH
jgi:four helix bundle protein